MFSFTRKPKQPTKPVKLDIINAVELKKDCNYLLLADSRHISPEEMRDVIKSARKVGVKNIAAFLMNGGDKNVVQLIDRPARPRGKNGKFVKKGK